MEALMFHSYRDLHAWQKSMCLVKEIYRLTRAFPKEELFGLVQQMRRAAISIASNLAEGQGRLTTPEFRRFVGISRGSAMELQTQLLISQDLGYLGGQTQVFELLDDVCRLVNALQASLKPKLAGRPE
ncbi:MAG TPA: four helix bundle protein [Terriglobales bacterium]|nr:four helix bundle protein [Terriglobales bacterium]